MRELSIVLKTNNKKIKYYIENLSELINKDTQIIVINNDKENLEPNCDYKYYEYNEDYCKLDSFVRSVCKYDTVLFLDGDIEFEKKRINDLKESIEKGDNVKVIYKYYLNQEDFFLGEQFILINNKSKTEKISENYINNYNYQIFNEKDIERNIYYLLKANNNAMLEKWFCLNQEKNGFQNQFLNSLERLNFELKKTVDSSFNSKYITYKSIKQCTENDELEEAINKIKDIKIKKEELYFSYILLEASKESKFFLELYKKIDLTAGKVFIEYLLEQYDFFEEVLSNILLSINVEKEIAKPNNIDIPYYFELSRGYILNVSINSDNIEKKDVLLQVFVDYTNYGFYIINERKRKKIFIPKQGEFKFLDLINKGATLLNNNKVKEGLDILKTSSKHFQSMTKVVEFYIQKVIFEKKIHPYVLSICMIVRDEEDNIDRCLKSIKPLIDIGLAELIIVDTGSIDTTVEISRKYTDKVYVHPWQNSFSEARNFSISLAQGQFLFIVDADNEFEKEEIEKTINIFSDKSNQYEKYNTFKFIVKNFEDESYKKYSFISQNLIFRNDGSFYYEGKVHNQPIYKVPIYNTGIVELHYGYIMTEGIKDKKFQRTSNLLKKELEKDPDNLYYQSQLVASYGMHGDYKDALEQVELHIDKIMSDSYEGSDIMLFNRAALIYFNMEKYEELMLVCDKALKIRPDFIDFIYYKAGAYFNKKDFNSAKPYLKEYLDNIDKIFKSDAINDDTIGFFTLDRKENVQLMYLNCLYSLKEYKHYLEEISIFNNSNFLRNSVYLTIKAFFETGDAKALVAYYKDYIYNTEDTTLKMMFDYYLAQEINNRGGNLSENIIEQLNNVNISSYLIEKYIKSIKENNHFKLLITILDDYDLSNIDVLMSKSIVENILSVLKEFDIKEYTSKELLQIKKSIEYIFERTVVLNQFQGLTKESILNLFDIYIDIIVNLFTNVKEQLDKSDINFVEVFMEAFNNLNNKDIKKAIKNFKEAAKSKQLLSPLMDLYLETIFQEYTSNLTYFKVEENIGELKKYVENLINNDAIEEAIITINKNEELFKNHIEYYSILGVALIKNGELERAEKILQEGNSLDENNYDINYNLNYLHKLKGNK